MLQKPSKHNITPIRTGNSQVYLITNGSRSILVDAGIPGMAERILNAASQHNLTPEDIVLILVTHAHFDHVGSLAALKQATGASILAHSFEAVQIKKGWSSFPTGTTPVFRLVSFLGRKIFGRFGRFQPVLIDLEISGVLPLDEYGLDGLILPTPGHTMGSISLILEDQAAIVGDTLFGVFKRSACPPFADDPRLLVESWRTLLSTGCQAFYPAHGRPISRPLLESSLEQLYHRQNFYHQRNR